MKTIEKTTEKLTNITGYGILNAIVKHYPVDDHIKGRARFYLSNEQDLNWKLTHKRTEGSFFTAVLDGDIAKSIMRANKSLRTAICQALIDCEIYL